MSQPSQSPAAFAIVTLVAAFTASMAAGASLALSLPVWAMFVGWIAFFTRGLNTRTALENLTCVWIGLAIGLAAAMGIARMAPILGLGVALPLTVFAVALVVVSLRGLPVLNNLLGYFLGLVAWFAAHAEPSFESLLPLISASAIGSAAGWLAHHLPSRLLRVA